MKNASKENFRVKSLLDAANEQKNDLMKQVDDYVAGNQTLDKLVLERECELTQVRNDLQKLEENSRNSSEEFDRIQKVNETLVSN